MKIESGLFDSMVLQRNRKNLCDVGFEGRCETNGRVVARVKSKGRVLPGWNGKTIGKAAKGLLAGRLAGLPAGGPYDLELTVVGADGRALEAMSVRDVLVGDVWILGGQSNMQGCGLLRDRDKSLAHVRAFYMDDSWGVAEDPLHNLNIAVDPVHGGGCVSANKWQKIETTQPGSMSRGTGPGVTFGGEMWRSRGVPQGLIACAHGGTSMTQWDPANKKMGGHSLYGAMLRRFHKNGGQVAGVLWYQGCSDASKDAAPHYTRRMQKLVAAMRRDFKAPKLPVVMVQIAGVLGWGEESRAVWNSIQEQQRLLEGSIRNLAVVPAIDLQFDDTIHVSGKDQIRLGKRLALAMRVLQGDRAAGLPPITLESVRYERDEISERVVVKFGNVMGKLHAAGKASGFAFAGAPECFPGCYRIDLENDCAVINLAGGIAGKDLYYGYGLYPYCNITDSADRSLPVFGPVQVKIKPASDSSSHPVLFPPVIRFRVSRAMPPAGKLEGLQYPSDMSALKLQPRDCSSGFCDLHNDILKCAPEDRLVYFACRFQCREFMQLCLGLAYDGPLKVWLDRNEIFRDPAGVNPAGMDKALIPCEAKKGNHELLIALGSNFGKAWGIKLRFLRNDIPANLLKKGPQAYPTPRVLE